MLPGRFWGGFRLRLGVFAEVVVVEAEFEADIAIDEAQDFRF
jgi:hypothetical protein